MVKNFGFHMDFVDGVSVHRLLFLAAQMTTVARDGLGDFILEFVAVGKLCILYIFFEFPQVTGNGVYDVLCDVGKWLHHFLNKGFTIFLLVDSSNE